MEFIDYYGLKLSRFTQKSLSEYFVQVIDNKNVIVCYGHGLWSIPIFKKYPALYKICNSFDVLVCDGRGLYLLIKLLRFPIGEELSIPNLVNQTLRLANEKKYSLLIIGSTQSENLIATRNIKVDYPNINVFEGIDGYNGIKDEEKLFSKINSLSPDIILIGISIPTKEILGEKLKKNVSTRIIIPCGGMIDVLSGKTKQTPTKIKLLGFASLYRVFQEPKRLLKRYLYLYFELLFKFIPIFFFNVYILRKEFSIKKYCGIKD